MNRKSLCALLVAGFFSLISLVSSFGQGTAFVYQGQLGSGGAVANGTYDFQFTAYDAATSGNIVAGPVVNSAVGVTNGLFTTAVDFGANVFTGPGRWLGIAVRTNGATTFTSLTPRQPILPTPYSIFANSASNLVGVLPASSFTGGYANAVSLTNGANLFSGSFNGNGGAVTNVNVSNLTGVLVDNQLPSNTAYLNSNQVFTANNTFNGTNVFNGTNTFNSANTFNGANVFTNMLGNSFSGSFFGNGLVGWVVVSGTSQQASIDHGYVLTNAQVVTVTLPTSANVGDIVRIAGAGATGWQVAQNAGQSVLGNFITYGKVWTKTPQNGQWISMASSSDGTKMIAANYGTGLFISANSGATWNSVLTSPVQFVSVASSSDGTTLAGAVTNGGSIYVSTNSGANWAAIPGTGTSASTNWTSIALSSSGTQVFATANNLGLFVYTNKALEHFASGMFSWSCAASSVDGNNLAAVVYGGGIYTSANGGATWSGPFATTQNWKSITSSADGTKLAAVVSGGGIYTSINSGVTWTPTSAPTTNWVSIASTSDGGKLIAVASGGASGGNIYTSANWGATWLPQTNNAPTGVNWGCAASSSSGSVLAAGIYNSTSGGIYTSQVTSQSTTTVGTTGFISGGQGSAAELIYVGNNEFMPVSFSGTIWGN